MISRGVPTYRIRSRQLSRIQTLRFGTSAATGGTVSGRENAVTCCMGLRGLYFPQIVGKINPGLRPTVSEDRHLPCARFPRLTRKYSDAVNHTQTEKLKEHEKET